jgi:para-aminobenzoate synthetase/4-amino-4-deoxychorismate lyase
MNDEPFFPPLIEVGPKHALLIGHLARLRRLSEPTPTRSYSCAMTGTVRFDDLRPNQQRSAVFTNKVGEVTATSIDSVISSLEAAEAAAAAGFWAAGFVAYEAAPAFDPALPVRPQVKDLPLVWFGFYKDRLINPPAPEFGEYQTGEWTSDTSETAFADNVQEIRRQISEGNTYQTNYTTRLNADFDGDPQTLYRDITRAQSGGYGAYLDIGRYKILSASPELFFDWQTGETADRLTTRPMKGTAKRGRWAAEDLQRRSDLRASEKEIAENVIIVDLLRNDIGKVADFGTVEVTDLLRTEKYDTIWQLTSTISATTPKAMKLRDIFTALFPCGSITGAPKQSTMRIISKLEESPRGVYCGAIGFVSPPNEPGPKASFSVAIRTVVVDSKKGRAQYGVGGGVTHDSTPQGEYEELRVKAAVLHHGPTEFSLVETLRWDPTEGFVRLRAHLTRAAASADFFDIPFDEGQMEEELGLAVKAKKQPQRIRLSISRAGEVSVECEPYEPTNGLSQVVVDTERVQTDTPFLFHKTTRRENYEAAKARHPEANDVILVNENGQITESTIANIAVLLDGQWVTPPVTDGCLPGVLRGLLLESGDLVEASVDVAELEAAREVALISSLRGWRQAQLA